jgi:hypothetical protein
MKALDSLKKYLPALLYTLLGLVGCFVLYTLIMRIKGSGAVIGDVVADNAENIKISQETGVPKNRINEMRSVAHDVAYELETLKGMGFYEKLVHFQSDSDTLAILARVKSYDEMKLVGTFYTNQFTDNQDLYKDLKKTTLLFKINSIPYIAGLQ